MPTTAIAGDDDDPIIASYDVFISAPEAQASFAAPTPTVSSSSKLLLLQYPAHRPQSRPYNASKSQKPTALRLKPETGLLELDIPILTHQHYNTENGTRYQKALKESRNSNDRDSHGLAAGFNTFLAGPGMATPELRDIPSHASPPDSDEELETQTLGGKITQPTTRDPVYMLGTFHGTRLHLSQLDALVQMRPQLNYLDALDEVAQRSQTPAGRPKPGDIGGGLLGAPPKLESKAIDVKIKDNKDDAKDRNLNTNARLLRSIQQEPWQVFNWTDQDEPESHAKLVEMLHLSLHSNEAHDEIKEPPFKKLKSAITNSEWLDKMSAPRETGHGKKGLLAKLRGRERERARRKRNDGERRARQKQAVGDSSANPGVASHTASANSLFQHESDSSELSSLDGFDSDDDSDDETQKQDQENERRKSKGKGRSVEEVDMVDLAADENEVEIKEETAPAPLAPQKAAKGAATKATTPAGGAPARRGRSRKGATHAQLDGAIEIRDDGEGDG